ncbi:MAG: CBS domain-containing protein [SAR324 cluster bacterium]|nr:CBS domain-containing protein [SAR324 cluster bacterium]
MFVGKRMVKDLVVLRRDQSLMDASGLIKKHDIRHLPVVDENNHLVGIVTDRDVRKASASDATSLDIHELLYLLGKIQVEEIMTKNVVSVPPSMPLEQAAKVMHDRKFGGLPVVEDGKLVGIITTGDILKFLMEAMDVDSSCTRVELELEDKPGQLVKVLQAISSNEYQIHSVITSPEKTGGNKIVTLHLTCDDEKRLRTSLEAQFKVISFLHQEPM